MCEFASFILTKDKELWLPDSDRHERIIEHYKLHVDGTHGPNILRVELTPPRDGDMRDLSRWKYKVDQDILPEWVDHARDEARARSALEKRAADGLKAGTLDLSGCTGLKALPDGLKATTLYLSGCTGLKALPDGLKATTLYLSGCTGLKALPEIIKGVGRIYR